MDLNKHAKASNWKRNPILFEKKNPIYFFKLWWKKNYDDKSIKKNFKKKASSHAQSACDEASIIKDNSISLLEFVFDLNFDEIIFPENPIEIVQNKDKDSL